MPPDIQPRRTWSKKFRDANRGVSVGVRGQSSFTVHFIAAGLVITAGALLHVSHTEWCLLALCIAMVLTAEMFNSALERLARAITQHDSQHVADALDIGSAAVLLTAVAAAIVGATILVPHLATLLETSPIAGG